MSTIFSANFRQNIIRFTWTWITLLFIVGIVSLFSIWSMNRAYHQASLKALAIAELNNNILSARIDFKIQVQEWKNILLRSHQAEDRKHYEALFNQQIDKVQHNLNTALNECHTLKLVALCPNIAEATQQHQQLAQRYRQQLAHATLDNYKAIHQLDQTVRGIDRQLDTQMDKLSNQFSELQNSHNIVTSQALDQRYQQLRKFILLVMSIALVVTTLSLYRLLRRMRE